MVSSRNVTQQMTIPVAGMREDPPRNLKVVTDYLTSYNIDWLVATNRGYASIEVPRNQAARARQLLRALMKKQAIPTLEVGDR